MKYKVFNLFLKFNLYDSFTWHNSSMNLFRSCGIVVIAWTLEDVVVLDEFDWVWLVLVAADEESAALSDCFMTKETFSSAMCMSRHSIISCMNHFFSSSKQYQPGEIAVDAGLYDCNML